MNDDIPALLKVHDYFHGVSEAALKDVMESGQIRTYAAGEIVYQPQDPITSVYFVLRGRLKAVKVDAQGRESLFRYFERGEQMGMMMGFLQEPVPVRVFAVEPTTLLQVETEHAMALTHRHADLRQNWLRTYATGLRKVFFGGATKRAPMMLAIIHHTNASRAVGERLIQRLHEIGESLAVLSDSEQSRDMPEVRFRSLLESGQWIGPEKIRQQVSEWQDVTRIVFDTSLQVEPDVIDRMMQIVDRAVYILPTAEADSALPRLRGLQVAERGWRDKLSIAWLLAPGRTVAPAVPGLHEVAHRNFKLAHASAESPWGRSLGQGLERLVHDLRGVRIGVALGGGAARGMAHLGVLKALEDNGIVVDMIAGTSAGAMTGVVYASGLDPSYSARQFAGDLQPSRFFRSIPRGNHWFLIYKYRFGHFDPMLRKYLHDWRLEQLSTPCVSVTVDLVGGKPVVRERGDAVHAILESINLPVLSVPIVREGQALIDGGLINNIPADVLVSMGCNFVIAVSVTAKMEAMFCDITAEKPTASRKRPGIVSTLLRSLLVQSHNLNDYGVRPADVVIAPDVTAFDMTHFMRAQDLAAVGEAAALEEIPKIRQLLNRLDPQLFPAQTR
jgi:predicted acylesterase/phospholipase RssA/CRP-like cAMP-binding protein